ncbi:MAG: transposase [Nitrosopumilaceae archaeon]|nr:transposase [Nitrosopumilaceae archaeon]
MRESPRWQVPRMFTFPEHPGVDPTNNASERTLRHMAVFRKIIGLTKGGPGAMRRLADFATCVLTWRRHGKSVYEEVARPI